jgi:vancomycin resistance protein VanW
MTLHTPLKVTERYRHSYDVFPDSNRKQPFGSGATCVYNYVDLQIENTTNEDFQLIVYITDNHLVGEWRSNTKAIYDYEIYEKEHYFNREYWGGYTRHNLIHRKVYNLKGIELKDEFVTENHAITMYEPLIEEKVK